MKMTKVDKAAFQKEAGELRGGHKIENRGFNESDQRGQKASGLSNFGLADGITLMRSAKAHTGLRCLLLASVLPASFH